MVAKAGDGSLKSVDILSQQIVGSLVFLEKIAVGGAAGEEATEEETKESSTEGSQGFPSRKRRGIGHSSGRGAKGSASERAAAGREDS